MLSFFIVSYPVSSLAKEEAEKQPNIIFIFADDLAYDTIGTAGGQSQTRLILIPLLEKELFSRTLITREAGMVQSVLPAEAC